MFNILILEDDPLQSANLVKIIEKMKGEFKVFQAFCVEEAINIASKEDINLFFIDIDVRGESGIDFAFTIRKLEKYKLTWMVFITTYVEHMLEAFKKIHCYDYILKPYDKEDVEKVIQVISDDVQASAAPTIEERKYLFITLKGIKLKIFLDEIYFIEVYFRICIIHTVHGKYELERITLTQLKAMIGTYDIIQCHRSYLVNMHYIKKIDFSKDSSSSTVYLIDYDETPLLGKSFKLDILSYFDAKVQ